MTVVVGQDPSDEEAMWLEAGRDLTPQKSLERIEAQVGFVFKNLALLGTVLAGAGIVGGLSPAGRSSRGWQYALVAVVGASVAFAAFANLPSSKSEINPSNVLEIQRFFERRIRWKGWATRIAVTLFSIALVLAFVVLLSFSRATPDPSLLLSFTRDGATLTVSAEVKAQRMTTDMISETTITGVGQDQKVSVLFRNVAQADADGKIAVKAEVKNLTGFRSFRLANVIRGDSKTGPARSVEVTP